MDDPPQKWKILLIEDNSGDVELLELALKHAQVNYDLTVFRHGGDALDFIQQHSTNGDHIAPDLAIIDLNLPQHDGLEVLEAMRASATFANVPVTVFSSSSLPREQKRMEALHIKRYITKPADLDKLLEVGMILKEILIAGHSTDNSLRG